MFKMITATLTVVQHHAGIITHSCEPNLSGADKDAIFCKTLCVTIYCHHHIIICHDAEHYHFIYNNLEGKTKMKKKLC